MNFWCNKASVKSLAYLRHRVEIYHWFWRLRPKLWQASILTLPVGISWCNHYIDWHLNLWFKFNLSSIFLWLQGAKAVEFHTLLYWLRRSHQIRDMNLIFLQILQFFLWAAFWPYFRREALRNFESAWRVVILEFCEAQLVCLRLFINFYFVNYLVKKLVWGKKSCIKGIAKLGFVQFG